MKINHDGDRCCSSGMCESFAPEVFEIDDDGALQVLDPSPDESQRGVVEMAVASCPTNALSLE
jgi:ferredoxin